MCIFSVFSYAFFVCANIFGAIVLKPRFKIYVFIMIICSIVIIINSVLKVPKHEIFDRSDFPDFYTIKSLRVGDFGVKIKKISKNI